MNQQETHNRQLYLTAFSRLHASAELDLEEIMLKSETKKSSGAVRCRRGLLVTALIMVMLFAMSAVAFAATDGEIVKDVKTMATKITVWINGERLDDSVITKGEDGSITVDIHEGDQIRINGDAYEESVDVGSMNGKLKFNTKEEEDSKSVESQLIIEEIPESAAQSPEQE